MNALKGDSKEVIYTCISIHIYVMPTSVYTGAHGMSSPPPHVVILFVSFSEYMNVKRLICRMPVKSHNPMTCINVQPANQHTHRITDTRRIRKEETRFIADVPLGSSMSKECISIMLNARVDTGRMVCFKKAKEAVLRHLNVN